MAGEISNPEPQQPSAELKADDILDFLNTDDSSEETSEETETETEPEPETSEEPEVKEEEEEEEEQEEEKETLDPDEKIEIDDTEIFSSVPKRSEILKAFPDLYKKFPAIEKALYRELEYSQIYPTIDAAKESQERLGRFENLESDLISGEIQPLFQALSKANEKSFEKITDNILDTLYKVDQKAYWKTTERVVRDILYQTAERAKTKNNDQLKLAAEIINEFLFEDREIKPFSKPAQDEDPREKTIREKEIAFAKQQLDLAVNDVNTRAQNVIKNTIDKHIDPKGLMTPYLRNKAILDVLTEVNKTIQSDKRFIYNLENLWKDAASNNYSDEKKNKIKGAICGKAQSVIGPIIAKVRSEALKGAKVKVSSSNEKKESVKIPAGKKSESKTPTGRMSTFDFLNSD